VIEELYIHMYHISRYYQNISQFQDYHLDHIKSGSYCTTCILDHLDPYIWDHLDLYIWGNLRPHWYHVDPSWSRSIPIQNHLKQSQIPIIIEMISTLIMN